jgi:predicted aconitase with swiveling domain
VTSVLEVRSLVAGKAQGALLVLSDGLSFWGGLDPASGEIVDNQHPQRGQNVRGKVILLPSPKGSTAAPGAMLECLRAGNGPAAIVLVRPDVTPIAAVLAAEIAAIPSIPIVQLLHSADLARFELATHALLNGEELTLS